MNMSNHNQNDFVEQFKAVMGLYILIWFPVGFLIGTGWEWIYTVAASIATILLLRAVIRRRRG